MAENYQGSVVRNKAGNQVDLSQSQLVGYYFSASWCPPCRGFTPILEETYQAWSADKRSIEVVLVSSDQDPEAAMGYYNKMSFCMLDFNDMGRKSFLSQKYGVSGIPCLVIVARDGTMVSKVGVQEVKAQGSGAFGMWMEMSGQQQQTPQPKELAKPHAQSPHATGEMKIVNGAWVYEGCIEGHQMLGGQDWQYGHNRMLSPGTTNLSIRFATPVGGNGIKFQWNYFGPWQMSPCTASISLNGQMMKDQ